MPYPLHTDVLIDARERPVNRRHAPHAAGSRQGAPAHRLTQAGSALYAHICTLCAATDAPGDRRLVKPCPGTA